MSDIHTTATCRADEDLDASRCVHCTKPTFLRLQIVVAHIELGDFAVCIECQQQMETLP